MCETSHISILEHVLVLWHFLLTQSQKLWLYIQYMIVHAILLYQTPPLRVLLLGARGSGKTEVGRLVASSYGVFHVALKDYLQEQIISKMKRPPLVHEDEWDSSDQKEEKSEDQHGLLLHCA